MKISLFYFLLLLSLSDCSTISKKKKEKASSPIFVNNCEKVNIDSFFAKWNIATMRSIESNVKYNTDTLLSKYCKALAGNFMAMNDLNQIAEINRSSIRYLFLEQINSEGHLCPPLYIVEAGSEGEQVILKNFLVFGNEKFADSICCYTYVNRKWIKTKTNVGANFSFQKEQFGKGQNPNDVIITRLDFRWDIKLSEYFVYNTLNISPLVCE
ncbi:hypothetical protein [Niabella sp.]|uniref:hypothetical protein n=1 Tax=Niabella sp. TaxID=1962976 RepID=UPI0026029D20|nr:hypothetical protein [Niabella sp.]